MNPLSALDHINAIQWGDFTLKSGQHSPFYIDLRRLVSYPAILIQIADLIAAQIDLTAYDCICGVPYTALPIATVVSVRYQLPMVMLRKERKEYGTGRSVEGVFDAGQRCLLIEDVITTGGSLLAAADTLQQEGLLVDDLLVILDRQQGGRNVIEQSHRLHVLFTMDAFLDHLLDKGKATAVQVRQARAFLREAHG